MTKNDDDIVRVHHVQAYQIGPVREDDIVVFRPYFAQSELQYVKDGDGIMGLSQRAAIDIAKRLVASVEALQTGKPFEYATETLQ